MSTGTSESLKADLCSQIEDIVAILDNAEKSAQSGDFDISAGILKIAAERMATAEAAARNISVTLNRTSWVEFTQPILEELVREGGSAKNWQIFEFLEGHMDFSEGDRKPHVADSRETVWQHTCRVAAREMRDESLGYLEPTTVQGVWTITDTGRRHLEELHHEEPHHEEPHHEALHHEESHHEESHHEESHHEESHLEERIAPASSDSLVPKQEIENG